MLPEPLQSFISIRHRLATKSASGGQIRGTLQLDRRVVEQLRTLCAAELVEQVARIADKTIYLDGLREDALGEIEIILVPYNLRKTGITYLENVSELIVQFRAAPPSKQFYLNNPEFYSADAGAEKPPEVQYYQDIQSLVTFLKEVADVSVPESNDLTLHFFAKSQLEVPMIYGPGDLKSVPDLPALIAKFHQPETRDQHSQILKTVIVEKLRGESKNKRFSVLLRDWEGIVQSFEHSYKLYLQNFSWEKLRGEIEKEKFELTRKISATVSDIQTKLIAIPAAITFAATQISNSESWTKNVLVLLGAVVFSALVELVLANQRRYLDAVQLDCASVHERLSKQYSGVGGLASEWETLHNAIRKQRVALRWISVCNWAVPLGTLTHILIVFA